MRDVDRQAHVLLGTPRKLCELLSLHQPRPQPQCQAAAPPRQESIWGRQQHVPCAPCQGSLHGRVRPCLACLLPARFTVAAWPPPLVACHFGLFRLLCRRKPWPLCPHKATRAYQLAVQPLTETAAGLHQQLPLPCTIHHPNPVMTISPHTTTSSATSSPMSLKSPASQVPPQEHKLSSPAVWAALEEVPRVMQDVCRPRMTPAHARPA